MSIKQNAYSDGLPDFRNLGVIARILVAVNLAAIGAACYAEPGWARGMARFADDAAFIEPALLASIVALYLISPALVSMRYLLANVVVVAVVLCIVAGMSYLPQSLSAPDERQLARRLVFSAAISLALLGYLRLRAKAFSPALTEARLQALQARIRPHFLFNSLNAVLSLIRRDPKRA